MRCVCWDWYEIIHNPAFINTHLMRSNHGLLIHNWRCNLGNFWYVELRNGKIEANMLEVGCLNVPILASCRGLVLLVDRRDNYTFQIVNPVTKQLIVLPRFFKHVACRSICSIGYATSPSGLVFKVVYTRVFVVEKGFNGFGIVTVGVDVEWRFLDLSHLSRKAKDFFWISHAPPISVGTRLFLAPSLLHPVILMFDFETEIVHELPYPPLYEWKSEYVGLNDVNKANQTRKIDFIPMGDSLYCFDFCTKFVWDIWELNGKLLKAGRSVWTKILKVNNEYEWENRRLYSQRK